MRPPHYNNETSSLWSRKPRPISSGICCHQVEAYRRVGVKFDFKDSRCVEPCLKLLRELAGPEETVGWPVFLNADVWAGPGGNPPKILPADFFAACFDIYPAGTLSPGWTCWLKFDGPSDAASRLLDPMLLEGYNLQQVEDALRTLPRGVGHVTFPVHCTMARVGKEAIVKLLEADDRFTLTLWSIPEPCPEYRIPDPESRNPIPRPRTQTRDPESEAQSYTRNRDLLALKPET
jgi:hypothetical protein